MRYSESVVKLAPALLKLQAQTKNLRKLIMNEFLGTAYVDLPTVLNEIKPKLTANKLVLIQGVESKEGQPCVVTRIMHASGEFVESDTTAKMIEAPDKFEDLVLDRTNYLQKFGGQITYMRRYALFGMLGIGTQDQDGNGSVPSEPELNQEAPFTDGKKKKKSGKKKELPNKAAGKQITLGERLNKLPQSLKDLLDKAGANTPEKKLGVMRKNEWDETAAAKACLKQIEKATK